MPHANNGNAKPLLLFFTASQSGPARRMESLLAHLARKERARLRISLIDVEDSPELAEALDVKEVPTLVLVHDRRPVARLEGRASAPQIERMVAPYLPRGNREPAAVLPSGS
ncbi:MAG: thioredoxin family protein [Gaiellaceae bacterium]